MVIKKYLAASEKDAMVMAKDDLGNDAIVMNIKKIRPKGIFRMFLKEKVEVTVAVDENSQPQNPQPKVAHSSQTPAMKPSGTSTYKPETSLAPNSRTLDALEMAMKNGALKNETSDDTITVKSKTEVTDLEKRIDNIQDSIQDIIDKKIKKNINEEIAEESAKESNSDNDNEEVEGSVHDKNEACRKLIYTQLINADMEPEYANELISEIQNILNADETINGILAAVYQKIILKLGQLKPITHDQGDKTKFYCFVGPTGVGKTTTIAKIVSDLKINKKAKVAMITADTYRIAAVEQLKTYANILAIPLKVVYSPEEMSEAVSEFDDYDYVLIDTAGRSHLSEQQQLELKQLLDSIPEKRVYLTLSVTTKYKDLLAAVNMYKKITEYILIFTKLDETTSIGCIYNIRRKTGAPLSYITYGQNVPDDFEQLDSQLIAKKLLGGM